MAVKKLLVADDSLTIQKVIRLALSSEGYDIQSVSDGNDALQQIALIRPDVVLIDVSLPGKTAFDVKRAINRDADLQFVRFVLMSSAFEQVDETQAQEVLFHGRLIKPFDPAHLREVIQKVLASVPERDPDFSSFVSPNQIEKEEPTKAPVFSTYADNAQPIPVSMPTPEVVTQAKKAAAQPENPYRSDEDIRQLTDSTMHMSGMTQTSRTPAPAPHAPTPSPGMSAMPSPSVSDEGWSVQERSLKDFGGFSEAPAPTPPPATTTKPQKTRYIEIPSYSEEVPTRAPKPPAPPAGLPPFFEDEPTLNPDYPLMNPNRAAPTPAPMSPIQAPPPVMMDEITNPLINVASVPLSTIAPGTPGLGEYSPAPSAPVSSQEIEEMVRRQLEARLEEMARRLLPEVAEKIIRQEIQKLLQEQP